MALYEWDVSYELGIPSIDEQHKALFGWINSLDEAIRNGEGSEAVGEVIWKLITYVTEHFRDEELLMLSSKYPGMSAHRKEHDQFVLRLREIQANFLDGDEMSRQILDFMVDWLVSHIKGTDQGYRGFILQQEVI
jgi:hemerythrin